MPDPDNDWLRPIDWEQIRWDRFAGLRPPIEPGDLFGPIVPSVLADGRGNARSWRWSRRARRLGMALALLLMLLALFLAAKHGLDKQDRWWCSHGVTDACHGRTDPSPAR